jgi:hypothetical protein
MTQKFNWRETLEEEKPSAQTQHRRSNKKTKQRFDKQLKGTARLDSPPPGLTRFKTVADLKTDKQ